MTGDAKGFGGRGRVVGIGVLGAGVLQLGAWIIVCRVSLPPTAAPGFVMNCVFVAVQPAAFCASVYFSRRLTPSVVGQVLLAGVFAVSAMPAVRLAQTLVAPLLGPGWGLGVCWSWLLRVAPLELACTVVFFAALAVVEHLARRPYCVFPPIAVGLGMVTWLLQRAWAGAYAGPPFLAPYTVVSALALAVGALLGSWGAETGAGRHAGPSP